MCKATLLKITRLAVALRLAFSFVFGRRWITAGNLPVDASFGSWLTFVIFAVFLADDVYVAFSLYSMCFSDESVLTSVRLGCCN